MTIWLPKLNGRISPSAKFNNWSYLKGAWVPTPWSWPTSTTALSSASMSCNMKNPIWNRPYCKRLLRFFTDRCRIWVYTACPTDRSPIPATCFRREKLKNPKKHSNRWPNTLSRTWSMSAANSMKKRGQTVSILIPPQLRAMPNFMPPWKPPRSCTTNILKWASKWVCPESSFWGCTVKSNTRACVWPGFIPRIRSN